MALCPRRRVGRGVGRGTRSRLARAPRPARVTRVLHERAPATRTRPRRSARGATARARRQPRLARVDELVESGSARMYSPLNALELLHVEERRRRVARPRGGTGRTISRTARSRGRRAAPSPSSHQVVAHGLGEVALVAVAARAPPCRGASTASGASRSRGAGTWANTGWSPPPRASHSSIAFGVFGRCSSPRMTWRDAHVDVVDHVGEDEHRQCRRPRWSTKSSISAFSNVGVAADQVDDLGGALARRAEPQRPAVARPQAAVAAEAVVAGRRCPSSARRSPRGCSRSSRRGRLEQERAPRHRAYSAVRWLWKYGPSSQSTPIHRARSRCPRSTRRGCARRRCPRCAGRTCPRAGGRRSSCRGRSAPRPRGSSPSGRGANRTRGADAVTR